MTNKLVFCFTLNELFMVNSLGSTLLTLSQLCGHSFLEHTLNVQLICVFMPNFTGKNTGHIKIGTEKKKQKKALNTDVVVLYSGSLMQTMYYGKTYMLLTFLIAWPYNTVMLKMNLMLLNFKHPEVSFLVAMHIFS